MKITIIILLSLFGATAPILSQVNWSASLGGGISYMNDYFEDHLYDNYQGDYLIEGGILADASFRKDGMLSWQTGLLIRHSGFKSTPVDLDGIQPGNGGIHKDNIRWDWENTTAIRNWSLKLPVSLMFNVFKPIGIKFGGHLNYVLSTGMENSAFSHSEKWVPGAHLGLFFPLGQRIHITGQVSSDISPRVTGNGQLLAPDLNYRELSFSLQVKYKLNP